MYINALMYINAFMYIFSKNLNDNHLRIPSTTLFCIWSKSCDHNLLIFLFHSHIMGIFSHYVILCIFITHHYHWFCIIFLCGWLLHIWSTYILHMFDIEHFASIHNILFIFSHTLRILIKILFEDTILYSDFSQFPN